MKREELNGQIITADVHPFFDMLSIAFSLLCRWVRISDQIVTVMVGLGRFGTALVSKELGKWSCGSEKVKRESNIEGAERGFAWQKKKKK